MLYALCLKCNENCTVPEPREGWGHNTVISCPTCGEPLSILGVALSTTEHTADEP
jgi:hypothetical protein